jgi:hypothetical protein
MLAALDRRLSRAGPDALRSVATALYTEYSPDTWDTVVIVPITCITQYRPERFVFITSTTTTAQQHFSNSVLPKTLRGPLS